MNIKIGFAIISFVIIQGIALVWYVAKLDSKVNEVHAFVEQESKKDVVKKQAKMEFDIERLIAEVEDLSDDMKALKDKETAIIEQHNKLFELLREGNRPAASSSYSYD